MGSLYRAGMYLSAFVLTMTAFASTTLAQPRVKAGKTYSGLWYEDNWVKYVVKSQPAANVYKGEIEFPNGHIEKLEIRYESNQITVIRWLPGSVGFGEQHFKAFPEKLKDSNGRIYYRYGGALKGKGVGGAENENGYLFVYK